jgi:hypothetical protein
MNRYTTRTAAMINPPIAKSVIAIILHRIAIPSLRRQVNPEKYRPTEKD